MILGVTGVSGCHRIKFFSYKLRTEDRLTDFELRRVYSGLCVERRNLFAVNCQPNLFLKFLSRVSSDTHECYTSTLGKNNTHLLLLSIENGLIVHLLRVFLDKVIPHKFAIDTNTTTFTFVFQLKLEGAILHFCRLRP